jgi:hypothetical protein
MTYILFIILQVNNRVNCLELISESEGSSLQLNNDRLLSNEKVKEDLQKEINHGQDSNKRQLQDASFHIPRIESGQSLTVDPRLISSLTTNVFSFTSWFYTYKTAGTGLNAIDTKIIDQNNNYDLNLHYTHGGKVYLQHKDRSTNVITTYHTNHTVRQNGWNFIYMYYEHNLFNKMNFILLDINFEARARPFINFFTLNVNQNLEFFKAVGTGAMVVPRVLKIYDKPLDYNMKLVSLAGMKNKVYQGTHSLELDPLLNIEFRINSSTKIIETNIENLKINMNSYTWIEPTGSLTSDSINYSNGCSFDYFSGFVCKITDAFPIQLSSQTIIELPIDDEVNNYVTYLKEYTISAYMKLSFTQNVNEFAFLLFGRYLNCTPLNSSCFLNYVNVLNSEITIANNAKVNIENIRDQYFKFGITSYNQYDNNSSQNRHFVKLVINDNIYDFSNNFNDRTSTHQIEYKFYVGPKVTNQSEVTIRDLRLYSFGGINENIFFPYDQRFNQYLLLKKSFYPFSINDLFNFNNSEESSDYLVKSINQTNGSDTNVMLKQESFINVIANTRFPANNIINIIGSTSSNDVKKGFFQVSFSVNSLTSLENNFNFNFDNIENAPNSINFMSLYRAINWSNDGYLSVIMKFIITYGYRVYVKIGNENNKRFYLGRISPNQINQLSIGLVYDNFHIKLNSLEVEDQFNNTDVNNAINSANDYLFKLDIIDVTNFKYKRLFFTSDSNYSNFLLNNVNKILQASDSNYAYAGIYSSETNFVNNATCGQYHVVNSGNGINCDAQNLASVTNNTLVVPLSNINSEIITNSITFDLWFLITGGSNLSNTSDFITFSNDKYIIDVASNNEISGKLLVNNINGAPQYITNNTNRQLVELSWIYLKYTITNDEYNTVFYIGGTIVNPLDNSSTINFSKTTNITGGDLRTIINNQTNFKIKSPSSISIFLKRLRIFSSGMSDNVSTRALIYSELNSFLYPTLIANIDFQFNFKDDKYYNLANSSKVDYTNPLITVTPNTRSNNYPSTLYLCPHGFVRFNYFGVCKQLPEQNETNTSQVYIFNTNDLPLIYKKENLKNSSLTISLLFKIISNNGEFSILEFGFKNVIFEVFAVVQNNFITNFKTYFKKSYNDGLPTLLTYLNINCITAFGSNLNQISNNNNNFIRAQFGFDIQTRQIYLAINSAVKKDMFIATEILELDDMSLRLKGILNFYKNIFIYNDFLHPNIYDISMMYQPNFYSKDSVYVNYRLPYYFDIIKTLIISDIDIYYSIFNKSSNFNLPYLLNAQSYFAEKFKLQTLSEFQNLSVNYIGIINNTSLFASNNLNQFWNVYKSNVGVRQQGNNNTWVYDTPLNQPFSKNNSLALSNKTRYDIELRVTNDVKAYDGYNWTLKFWIKIKEINFDNNDYEIIRIMKDITPTPMNIFRLTLRKKQVIINNVSVEKIFLVVKINTQNRNKILDEELEYFKIEMKYDDTSSINKSYSLYNKWIMITIFSIDDKTSGMIIYDNELPSIGQLKLREYINRDKNANIPINQFLNRVYNSGNVENIAFSDTRGIYIPTYKRNNDFSLLSLSHSDSNAEIQVFEIYNMRIDVGYTNLFSVYSKANTFHINDNSNYDRRNTAVFHDFSHIQPITNPGTGNNIPRAYFRQNYLYNSGISKDDVHNYTATITDLIKEVDNLYDLDSNTKSKQVPMSCYNDNILIPNSSYDKSNLNCVSIIGMTIKSTFEYRLPSNLNYNNIEPDYDHWNFSFTFFFNINYDIFNLSNPSYTGQANNFKHLVTVMGIRIFLVMIKDGSNINFIGVRAYYKLSDSISTILSNSGTFIGLTINSEFNNGLHKLFIISEKTTSHSLTLALDNRKIIINDLDGAILSRNIDNNYLLRKNIIIGFNPNDTDLPIQIESTNATDLDKYSITIRQIRLYITAIELETLDNISTFSDEFGVDKFIVCNYDFNNVITDDYTKLYYIDTISGNTIEITNFEDLSAKKKFYDISTIHPLSNQSFLQTHKENYNYGYYPVFQPFGMSRIFPSDPNAYDNTSVKYFSEEFTIEIWFRITNLSSSMTIRTPLIGDNCNSNTTFCINISISFTQIKVFYFNASNSPIDIVTKAITISNDENYHRAIISYSSAKKENTISILIDNIIVNSETEYNGGNPSVTKVTLLDLPSINLRGIWYQDSSSDIFIKSINVWDFFGNKTNIFNSYFQPVYYEASNLVFNIDSRTLNSSHNYKLNTNELEAKLTFNQSTKEFSSSRLKNENMTRRAFTFKLSEINIEYDAGFEIKSRSNRFNFSPEWLESNIVAADEPFCNTYFKRYESYGVCLMNNNKKEIISTRFQTATITLPKTITSYSFTGWINIDFNDIHNDNFIKTDTLESTSTDGNGHTIEKRSLILNGQPFSTIRHLTSNPEWNLFIYFYYDKNTTLNTNSNYQYRYTEFVSYNNTTKQITLKIEKNIGNKWVFFGATKNLDMNRRSLIVNEIYEARVGNYLDGNNISSVNISNIVLGINFPVFMKRISLFDSGLNETLLISEKFNPPALFNSKDLFINNLVMYLPLEETDGNIILNMNSYDSTWVKLYHSFLGFDNTTVNIISRLMISKENNLFSHFTTDSPNNDLDFFTCDSGYSYDMNTGRCSNLGNRDAGLKFNYCHERPISIPDIYLSNTRVMFIKFFVKQYNSENLPSNTLDLNNIYKDILNIRCKSYQGINENIAEIIFRHYFAPNGNRLALVNHKMGKFKNVEYNVEDKSIELDNFSNNIWNQVLLIKGRLFTHSNLLESTSNDILNISNHSGKYSSINRLGNSPSNFTKTIHKHKYSWYRITFNKINPNRWEYYLKSVRFWNSLNNEVNYTSYRAFIGGNTPNSITYSGTYYIYQSYANFDFEKDYVDFHFSIDFKLTKIIVSQLGGYNHFSSFNISGSNDGTNFELLFKAENFYYNDDFNSDNETNNITLLNNFKFQNLPNYTQGSNPQLDEYLKSELFENSKCSILFLNHSDDNRYLASYSFRNLQIGYPENENKNFSSFNLLYFKHLPHNTFNTAYFFPLKSFIDNNYILNEVKKNSSIHKLDFSSAIKNGLFKGKDHIELFFNDEFEIEETGYRIRRYMDNVNPDDFCNFTNMYSNIFFNNNSASNNKTPEKDDYSICLKENSYTTKIGTKTTGYVISLPNSNHQFSTDFTLETYFKIKSSAALTSTLGTSILIHNVFNVVVKTSQIRLDYLYLGSTNNLTQTTPIIHNLWTQISIGMFSYKKGEVLLSFTCDNNIISTNHYLYDNWLTQENFNSGKGRFDLILNKNPTENFVEISYKYVRMWKNYQIFNNLNNVRGMTITNNLSNFYFNFDFSFFILGNHDLSQNSNSYVTKYFDGTQRFMLNNDVNLPNDYTNITNFVGNNFYNTYEYTNNPIKLGLLCKGNEIYTQNLAQYGECREKNTSHLLVRYINGQNIYLGLPKNKFMIEFSSFTIDTWYKLEFNSITSIETYMNALSELKASIIRTLTYDNYYGIKLEIKYDKNTKKFFSKYVSNYSTNSTPNLKSANFDHELLPNTWRYSALSVSVPNKLLAAVENRKMHSKSFNDSLNSIKIKGFTVLSNLNYVASKITSTLDTNDVHNLTSIVKSLHLKSFRFFNQYYNINQLMNMKYRKLSGININSAIYNMYFDDVFWNNKNEIVIYNDVIKEKYPVENIFDHYQALKICKV